ncbi:MAG: class I SAM-dependent methyltransferase [Anaerolineae bacterium]|nr:class I SAM-dependent methyltransferase [Anaerolineae bacterium]
MTFTQDDLRRLVAAEPFPELRRSAGDFQDIEFGGDEPALRGWMLLPDRELDGTRLFVDGKQIATAPITPVDSVAEFFWQVPHARWSGFSYALPRGYLQESALARVDIVGCRGEQPVCKIGAWFRPDIYTNVPLPPEELVWRVAHTRNMRGFRAGGFRAFGDFMTAALRHGAPGPEQQLLDWGCGCGRVTAHFGSFQDGPAVRGCDIDAEAIAWCNQNLTRGTFIANGLWPPTPYADASFDLIMSYSVFTHLSREAQQAWLSEMQRILKPGGLFLASVHGESAARLHMPDRVAQVQELGILDSLPDATLESFVPRGYYRAVFQTQAYTRAEWSEWFDILEFNEYGIGAYQDLVVMQKSLDPAKWNRPKTVNRVARGGTSSDAQAQTAELEREIATLKQQMQTQEGAMVALDKWAHEMERTVKQQQEVIWRYEQMLSVRLARRFRR